MRLLFWAPSPSTRRACGGTQTLPLQGAGVGTEHQGTWLWLRTRSSQMTRNTMSPGNEFRSNKEVTGEDEGSGRSSWAMRVRPRSRGPGGVVCPTAGHTRVPTDKCYSALLLNIEFVILGSAINKKINKTHTFWKRSKLFLFVDGMIIYGLYQTLL